MLLRLRDFEVKAHERIEARRALPAKIISRVKRDLIHAGLELKIHGEPIHNAAIVIGRSASKLLPRAARVAP